MPLFDYACHTCDHTEERLVGSWRAAPPDCPNGHGPMTRKIPVPGSPVVRGDNAANGYGLHAKPAVSGESSE